MHSMSFKTGKRMLYNFFFDGAYFLLAVMVEGDESSRRFWSATGRYCRPCIMYLLLFSLILVVVPTAEILINFMT